MAGCYELSTGCCGCPIRVTVCIALWHYMFFGIFIVTFVFTNRCYPPLYYVDYFFGGSGAALTLIAFLTALVVDAKKVQFIRLFMALLTILAVLSAVVSCFYYTIKRWNDIEVTLIVFQLRPAPKKDLPDLLWYTSVVLCCLSTPTLLIYLVYIFSFMGHKWKSYLFMTPYQHDIMASSFGNPITVPASYNYPSQVKPYPVQGQPPPYPQQPQLQPHPQLR